MAFGRRYMSKVLKLAIARFVLARVVRYPCIRPLTLVCATVLHIAGKDRGTKACARVWYSIPYLRRAVRSRAAFYVLYSTPLSASSFPLSLSYHPEPPSVIQHRTRCPLFRGNVA